MRTHGRISRVIEALEVCSFLSGMFLVLIVPVVLVLFVAAAHAGTIVGILADPFALYPPTSTTGYPVSYLANPTFQVGPGESVNQISIDGQVFFDVEADDTGAPPLPIQPVMPPTPVEPVTPSIAHHPHQADTPEPSTFLSIGFAVLLLWQQTAQALLQEGNDEHQ